jgi:hypothetical protein
MLRTIAVVGLAVCLFLAPKQAFRCLARVAPLPADDKAKPAAPGEQPLKLPAWWKKGDPLPLEKSNCVRCHLNAGRELTDAVRDFARSVHDLNRLTCYNCHGGDSKNDVSAHEPEHGFIGTKMSAHMTKCVGCHTRETLGFKKGKHYWDMTKGINRGYPACIDCHGNHDIGNPPAAFSLNNVCTDCHKQLDKELPQAAAVVAANDQLWKTLRQVYAKNKDAADPVPEEFRRERERVRSLTSRLIHRAGPITPQEAQEATQRTEKLRDQLDAWLKNQK